MAERVLGRGATGGEAELRRLTEELRYKLQGVLEEAVSDLQREEGYFEFDEDKSLEGSIPGSVSLWSLEEYETDDFVISIRVEFYGDS